MTYNKSEQVRMLEETAQRVRELRGEASQLEFAERLGVSRSYINTIERAIQLPSRNVLHSMKEKLGANPNWVLYGAGARYLDKDLERVETAPIERERQRVPKLDPKLRMGLEQFLGTGAAKAHRGHPISTSGSLLRDSAPEQNKTEHQGARAAFRASGYWELTDSKDIRIKALLDSSLVGTGLRQLVGSDELWSSLHDIQGWEFELLRQYQQKAGDPGAGSLVEVLSFIRLVMVELLQGKTQTK